MAEIRIRRIGTGPTLVVEDSEALVAHFLRTDASAQSGGYDDLAGHGERDRITRSDVVAINSTMRARSPHSAWDSLINDPRPLSWLAAIDPAWDLVAEMDERWQTSVRGPVDAALTAATGPGRGISVGSKVLHLKRPAMFPVLDSLVLEQLGVTDSVPIIRVVEHLRAEGVRNLASLRAVQAAIAPRKRSLVRILDVILWASHPASGLGPTMGGWERRLVRVEAPQGSTRSRPSLSSSSSPLNPSSASASPSIGTSSPSASASTISSTTDGGSTSTSSLPRRSFDDVWASIDRTGGFRAVSSRGTEYRVTADMSKARKVLIARPGSGAIYVHADCFGQDVTCQGTRAGGIYHGSPSVFDS